MMKASILNLMNMWLRKSRWSTLIGSLTDITMPHILQQIKLVCGYLVFLVLANPISLRSYHTCLKTKQYMTKQLLIFSEIRFMTLRCSVPSKNQWIMVQKMLYFSISIPKQVIVKNGSSIFWWERSMKVGVSMEMSSGSQNSKSICRTRDYSMLSKKRY